MSGRVLTRLKCLLLAAGAVSAPAAGSGPDTTGSPVVVQGVHLEHLFGGGSFTEGPAVAPDGCVSFSDLTFEDTDARYAGHLWRFDPRAMSCTVYRSPSNMSNGIGFDAGGRMVVAEGNGLGGRRIVRTDMTTGKSEVLAASYAGVPFNSPNDLTIAHDGRIIFTDPRYGDEKSVRQPMMGVYCIDTTGRASLLIGDVPMPNGVALSPDGHTLYVGCFDEGASEPPVPRARQMALFAYPLPQSGAPGPGRLLGDYGERDGPDGIEVDADGHIFAAVRDEARPGIAIHDTRGKEIGFIPLPEIPSNVAFDRPPHGDRLYVTAGRGLYRIHIKKSSIPSHTPEGTRHE